MVENKLVFKTAISKMKNTIIQSSCCDRRALSSSTLTVQEMGLTVSLIRKSTEGAAKGRELVSDSETLQNLLGTHLFQSWTKRIEEHLASQPLQLSNHSKYNDFAS